jgi:transcriptional regulator with XRE-family HTH domain
MMNDRLVKLRKERNETQASVAKLLGIERTTYGKYETGGIQPPIDVILRLSEIFDVTTDYLIGKSDSRETLYNAQNISNSSVAQGAGTIAEGHQDRRDLSVEERGLIRAYRALGADQRVKLLIAAFDMEKQAKSQREEQ